MFDITYSIANFTREFNGVKRGKATKTEWCLLGLTAAFLCLLLVLSHTEQVPLDPGVVVETETEVPQEEVAPPFEPVDLTGRIGEELAKTLCRDKRKEGYVQLLPGFYPGDGFFISVFRRKAESR